MAYKIIHEQFWTDPKIKNLSLEHKFLFLYLITNPHSHSTGIYYLQKKVIALDTGIDRGIDRGIKELSERGLISYDNDIEIIFIKNMLRHQSANQIYNDNQIKGIVKHLKTLHNTILIKDFLDFYKDLNIPYNYTPIDRGIDTPTYIYIDSDIDSDKGIVKGKQKEIKTAIADNFTISDRVKKWAEEKGYKNLDEHLENFILACKSKGYKYIDWDSAFMGAIRGDWAKVNQQTQGGGEDNEEDDDRFNFQKGDAKT